MSVYWAASNSSARFFKRRKRKSWKTMLWGSYLLCYYYLSFQLLLPTFTFWATFLYYFHFGTRQTHIPPPPQCSNLPYRIRRSFRLFCQFFFFNRSTTQWYILKYRILLCTSWVQFWARIYFWGNIRAPKSPYNTFKSYIRASKSSYITFKSNIRAQKWTQIGSNIRYFKMYHWEVEQV